MPNKILVANIGSTSFKFRLFAMPEERVLAKGGVERIGSAEGPWSIQVGDAPVEKGVGTFSDHAEAVAFVEEMLGGAEGIAAFGFKVVMGGRISGTQVLDENVLAAMEEMSPLFPAHNPPYIAAVRSFTRLHPEIPCIGTFETAFYDDVPEENRRYPVPREWEKKFGVRRYGFHGASHRYITERVAELRGERNLRIISCHLGGSSSIAAVRDGKAIDSSWGMTAQSGLPQNNRVGDFDVFATLHLIRQLGIDAVERALATDSGLKGMSGLPTGDVRDLLAASKSGNTDAQIALDVFVGQIRKFIGQFLVELNGADVLVFTAGIAENNPILRERICADLNFCGLELDPAANHGAIAEEAILSTPDSKIEVRLIPTNEELVIARNAWAKLSTNN